MYICRSIIKHVYETKHKHILNIILKSTIYVSIIEQIEKKMYNLNESLDQIISLDVSLD